MTKRRGSTSTQRWRKGLRFLIPFAVAGLLLLALAATGLASTGGAEGETTLSIAPASQEVVLGDTFTTDVWIEDVASLYTFEFRLSFDPALMEGVQVEPGGFLSPDWQLQNTINNDDGVVIYALSQLNPTEPVTGTGALATITWRGIATGTSPISFTHTDLYARGGVSIPATTRDGEIVVMGEVFSPTITSLSPVSATAGGPGFTLTVDGVNFVEGSTVHWDGEARTTAFVSSTQLTAEIAASDIATGTVGIAQVTVVNPEPGGGTSNWLPFEIAEFAPAPHHFVYLPLILRGD